VGTVWARTVDTPRFPASSAISRPTVCAVRVIEATELLALDVFNAGARQITLGDVERYLGALRNQSHRVRVWALRPRPCATSTPPMEVIR
jgi:hypothetical protein